MSVPLLVHVGLHKTGTTWLQDVVLKPQAGRTIELFCDFPRTHNAFIIPPVLDFEPALARATFAPLLAASEAAGRPAVITDEALGGFPFHHKFFREVVAERIARTLPEAHILVTIREQRAIIASAYSEYVRYGYSSSLAQFLAQPPRGSSAHAILDRDFYDYDRLARLYGAIFGEARVTFLPFEWMIAEPAAALAHVAARSGVTIAAPPPGARETVARPAWSDLANWAVRQLNRFHAQDARWQTGRRLRPGLLHPNSMGHRIDRWTPGPVRRSMRQAAQRLIAEAVDGYYTVSNRAAATRLGVDLARLGYG